MPRTQEQSRKMRSFSKPIALVAVMILFAAAPAVADWPQFRGPNLDGISSETGFKTKWTSAPPVKWERNLGAAFSSFACVGDRVYTCGTAGGKQMIYCLNADTGKTIWEKAIEKAYPESSGGDGTRATPTVDGDRVYILGARGTLLCLNTESGSELWRTTFHHIPQWGYSGSVLIEGDLAISSGGAKDGALVAFDKITGKQIWKTGDDAAGYATPYPFDFQGSRYIVGFTGNSALIVEAATGELKWRQPWKTDWNINAAAPIFHDGHLFLTSGYKTGAGLFKVAMNDGELSLEQVWKNKVLMNKFQSCILHEGKLYASDQKALVCADFLTGKELWRKPRIKHGTLVLADGNLILLTQDGRLRIAPVSAADFKPETDIELLSDRCWTVPVLHRGKLFARNLNRAVCFDLK